MHKKATDWVPQQEVLGFDLDSEKMTISLPTKKIRESQELPAGRRTATVRGGLVLAGNCTTWRM